MSDLIDRMQTQIQAWEKTDDNRVIFLGCYHMMTVNMLQAVTDKGFADGAWVTKLTHRFAGYYFDALAAYNTQSCPPVWTIAFETARQKNVHVLQHLLLGINAHICYDLIFALADSVGSTWGHLCESDRAERYRDFCHVNAVIGQTLDAVQDYIVERHSRSMIFVDRAFGRLDEWMVHRLITYWREQVWHQSVAYLMASGDDKPALKQRYAHEAAQRARAIQGQRGILGIIDLF